MRNSMLDEMSGMDLGLLTQQRWSGGNEIM